jgi:hypothetical protein
MATTLQAITVGPQIMRLAGHPVDVSPGAEASGRFSTTFAHEDRQATDLAV